MLSNAYFIIFSQNFVLMQPRTSPPKICKIANFANVANFVNVGPGAARRPARRGGAARGAEGGLQRRGRAVAVPGAGSLPRGAGTGYRRAERYL